MNEAVGAGVLLTVTLKVALYIEEPQAFEAKTFIVPEPEVLAAVILITLFVDVVADKFPVTTQE